MDKKQAFQILNNAIAGIQTTRQAHDLMMQALNVLNAPAVAPAPVAIAKTDEAKPKAN